MNRIVVWTCAAGLTLALSVWQRRSGPTYPVSGSVMVDGQSVRYRLDRSYAGPGDAPVRIAAPGIAGALEHRPAGSADAWSTTPMAREGIELVGRLPHQPIAGKLEYRVALLGATQTVHLPAVTIRFRGEVPAGVLVPHVLAMFLGFLMAARAGLAAINGEDPRRFAVTTLVLIGVGGLILGPIVQKVGLGAYWTGWPFGPDLTDNKTLVAWLFWLPAVFSRRRRWTAVAAAVTFVVFAIPHSVLSGNVAAGAGAQGPGAGVLSRRLAGRVERA